MKLATKLSAAMGTLALSAAFIGIFSLYQMNTLNMLSSEISENWLPSTVLVQRINTMTSDYRLNEVSHIFSEDKEAMAQYERKMADLKQSIIDTAAEYRTLISTPEEEAFFANFTNNWRAYQEESTKILELSRQLKTAEAIGALEGKSLQLFDTASEELWKDVQLNIQKGKESTAQGEALFSTVGVLLVSIIAFLLIGSVVLCVLIIRNTTKSLGKDPAELGALARRVAGGDLDVHNDKKAVGVYADILVMVDNLKTNIFSAKQESDRAKEESAKAQKAMQEAEISSAEATQKTKAMLAAANRLEEVADIVSSASAELSAQIEQSEHGAAEQAARVAETATAMEEMNSTVLEVARNASAAADVSNATRQKAEAGAHVVQESVESIQAVQHQALQLKSAMGTLDENARSISQIMSVISDIADQTNMLALNAAIEAARAGEAGRGFAVVADEVRKLAEKTMASTHDVGNAISSIQQSAAQSMAQVDQSVTYIEQATQLANQSGAALNEIVAMVDKSADQVRGIATASEEQSASSEEINRSILQVNTIASETARAMQEAAHAVSDLAKQAHVLSGLIDQMKQG